MKKLSSVHLLCSSFGEKNSVEMDSLSGSLGLLLDFTLLLIWVV